METIYRIYDERGGYIESSEKPEGLKYEIIEFKIDYSEIIKNEIENLDKENTFEISKLLAKHIEKKEIEGTPISEEILLKRKEMIADFHIKKAEIIEKYKNK